MDMQNKPNITPLYWLKAALCIIKKWRESQVNY